MSNFIPLREGPATKRAGTVLAYAPAAPAVDPNTYYTVPFDDGSSAAPLVAGDTITVVSPAAGTNIFSSDANAVSVWYFDLATGLGDDSLEKNDVTNSGAALDAVTYKQGTHSLSTIGGSEYTYRADSSLSADFPLKGGTTNRTFSMCGWVNQDSQNNAWDAVFSKYDNQNGERSLLMTMTTTSFQFNAGHTGGTGTHVYKLTKSPVFGVWYHYAITWNDADNAWRIRVYDDSDQSVSEATGTGALQITPGTQRIEHGGCSGVSWFTDMLIDEFCVFNDVLTADEIDEIRAGTYGNLPGSSASGTVQSITYDDSTTGDIIYVLTDPNQFADNDIMTNTSETVTVNGTPSVTTLVFSNPTSVRLIPFVFNAADSYVLGFGDETLSFYRTVNNVSGRIQE
jgi:hypothetical protein